LLALERLRQLVEMHAPGAPVAVLVEVEVHGGGPPNRRKVGSRGGVAGRCARNHIVAAPPGHAVPV
jgi:hypothetical protein